MIEGIFARVRSLWRGIRRSSALHAEMDEEFRLHIELRTEDLVRSGLAPAAALRQARLEFGSTEHFKDEGRDSRGLRHFDQLRVSWLDFKLGFRMLVRYPGLTLVGGLAIAFAIAVGAGAFEFATQVVNPTLPLDGGDRIVVLRKWDAAANRVERRAVHDFIVWRDVLASVEDLGAFRTIERNLITGTQGHGEPVEIAEITASAFRLARVPPLLGRTLVEADEEPGATPVVVIGYDVWRTRFGRDSGVVGRTVRLGRTQTTVVGVMPEGFAFPVAHGFWVPLRPTVLAGQPGAGAPIDVFGRLAPDVTRDQAQAELGSIVVPGAPGDPEARRQLRPQVEPYAQAILGPSELDPLALIAANVFLGMLLLLVWGNVAMLMFARAAMRESELVVRNALGASRGRIVMQLFAEALVLAGLAAVAGLWVAELALRTMMGVLEADSGGRLPFWFSASLAPATVLYAGLLTVLGAVVMGVVPALKATRGLAMRLRQAAVGRPRLRFGGVWTTVIVTQVALTVAFPATAFFAQRYVSEMSALDVGFPTREYLSMRLETDPEPPSGAPADSSAAASGARLQSTYRALAQRLEMEPGVVRVTFADRLPRTLHAWRPIQAEGIGSGAARGPDGSRCSLELGRPCASLAAVDPDFFDVIGVPIVSGRGFRAEDLVSDVPVVIVNRSFVQTVLGGRNPIGLRVRHADSYGPTGKLVADATPNPWHEIVGVVPDLGMIGGEATNGVGLYVPAAPGRLAPLHVLAHVTGAPASFAPRLRTLAAEVDPALRLHDVMPLDEAGAGLWLETAFLYRLLLVVSVVAVALSLSGIYSVMAVTVARRTREIGIRIALGASAFRVVTAVFARPLAQVACGLVAGGALVLMLTRLIVGLSAREVGLVGTYMALMLGVCLLACIVPTRRALRVEPTEALRADG